MTQKHVLVIKGGYRHYEVIDYLKGFSILTIVIMHLLQGYLSEISSVLSKMATIGGTGVHVFIFCSGFGLYLNYCKKPKTYVEFIKSRFKKLYIPYVLVVIVSSFIPWMYEGSDRLVALLSHVFLFKMFISKYEGSFGVQLWFISTIIQFYLIFIPLCHLKKKLKSTITFLLLGSIISVSWWVLMAVTGLSEVRIWGSFFLQYLWEFCLGMAAAEYLVDHNEIRLPIPTLIVVAVVGVGLTTIAFLSGEVFRIFNDIPALLGYGSFALIIYYLNYLNKVILFISKFSFEWYLVHMLVFSTVFLIPTSSLASRCVLGFVALILSMLIAWGYSTILKIGK